MPYAPGAEPMDYQGQELEVDHPMTPVTWDDYKQAGVKERYDSAAEALRNKIDGETGLVCTCVYPCAPNKAHDSCHYACIKAGCPERCSRPCAIMRHAWDKHPEMREVTVIFYRGWTAGKKVIFRPPGGGANNIFKPHPAKPNRKPKSTPQRLKTSTGTLRAKQTAVTKAVKAAERKASKEFNKRELRAQEVAAAQQLKTEAAEAEAKESQKQLVMAYDNIRKLIESNGALAQSNQTMAEAAKLQAENTSKALHSALQCNAVGRLGEAGRLAAQQIE